MHWREYAALRDVSEHIVFDTWLWNFRDRDNVTLGEWDAAICPELETELEAVSVICDTFSTKNVYFECPKTWWKLLKLALSAVGCEVLGEMTLADWQIIRTSCGMLVVTMFQMSSGNWELLVYHTGV